MLANVHRDTETRREPYSLEDVMACLGHSFQPPQTPAPAPEPPTTEQLGQMVVALNGLFGGKEVGG